MTKQELQKRYDKAMADREILRQAFIEIRLTTHESIKKGNHWSNSWLVQHCTELLERTK